MSSVLKHKEASKKKTIAAKYKGPKGSSFSAQTDKDDTNKDGEIEGRKGSGHQKPVNCSSYNYNNSRRTDAGFTVSKSVLIV